MTDPSGPSVRGLYRYPIKGMSPEALQRMPLRAGGTAPFDRAYAVENGPGRFDPEHPAHLPKINFLMLMRNERLATLETRFDDATETLTILRAGKQVARGDLRTPIGRKMIEQFLAAYMEVELRGAPRVVFAPGHSFSDVAAKCLHIVNLASLRELERVVGRAVNPLRFRPNVDHRWGRAMGRVQLDRPAPAARRRAFRGAEAHGALRGDQRRSRHRPARHGHSGRFAARLRPYGLRDLRAGHGRRHHRGRRSVFGASTIGVIARSRHRQAYRTGAAPRCAAPWVVRPNPRMTGKAQS